MTVSRGEVLQRLATMTDADTERTTTVAALAAALDAEESVVAEHVERLVACALARRRLDAGVRVTVTGEQLLALDTDGPVVVDGLPDDSGR